MTKILLLIFFCVSAPNIYAQFVNAGTDRSSIDWNKIETLHYIVIYPENYESQAIEYAMKLEKAYKYVNYSLGFEPKKFTYVLRTHSAVANGMTAVAPNKVELWTKPYQDSYGQAWDEQLILHEGRHVVQFTSMYRGASKLPIWLTGQMGYSFPVGLYIPNWFMEGDAVVTETALSDYGRGRQASFEKEMRAYFLQKGNPGYDKMILGSYRDFIPDHYATGYQIVAANRVFRDPDIFKTKLDKIARYPWYIWPFSRRSNGLKDTRKFKYYKYAADTLMELWKAQDQLVKADQPDIIYTSKDYSGLEYITEEGSDLYAYQSNLSRVPQIVKIDTSGFVVPVLSLGYNNGKYFDVKDHKLLYTLEMPNARWEQESQQAVYVYDMQKFKNKRLTHYNSYYSPVFNPVKDQIAAVEMNDLNGCNLVILNPQNGSIIKRLKNDNNGYIITPKWTPDGKSLVYIKITDGGKILCRNDFKEEKILFGPDNMDFKHPYVTGEYVFFSGDWSGIENIYQIPLTGGEPVRITNSRFGAISPTFIDGDLVYLDYTWKGNEVVKQNDNQMLNQNLTEVPNYAPNLYRNLAEMELGKVDFKEKDSTEYSISRYNKFAHQFNFHSWIPGAAYQLGGQAYLPGVSLLSQSMLNDATMSVGINFASTNKDEKFYFNYIYRGFLPVIHFNTYYGAWNQNILVIDETGYGYNVSTDINALRFEGKVEFPFVFRHLSEYITLSPFIYGSYASDRYTFQNTGSMEFDKGQGTRTFYGIGLYHSWLKQNAYRNLKTNWGYEITAILQKFDRHYKMSGSEDSQIYSGAEVSFYLPGFEVNHSLQLNLTFLHLSKDQPYGMVFTQPLSMPIGWSKLTNSGYGKDNYRIGFEYLFTLANADAEIFWLAYLKRLNFGVWADLGQFKFSRDEYEYNALGGTMYIDMNLFRYPIEWKVGAKVGYSFSHQDYVIEGIFNFGF
ncbi:TolB family protein [Saccharicrinis sp. FJH2]|uniref:TolB family protein n=1 Tax=Saccharicrinis sp. FJH65 TaxID=3344659 RepID=UPI0035F3016F